MDFLIYLFENLFIKDMSKQIENNDVVLWNERSIVE